MIHLLVATVLTLLQAQDVAVAKAPSVAQSRARVREDRALLAATSGGAVPHAIATYVQAPQGGTIGTITQRLFTYGGQIALGDIASAASTREQARATFAAAEADEIQSERAERIRTIGLYIDAIRTARIAALQASIVEAQRADARAASLRYQSGDAPRLDIVRADVARLASQADLAQALAARDTARRALEIELEQPAGSFTLPGLVALGSSTLPTRNPDSAVEIALRARPEIAAAQAEVLREAAAVRGAQRAALPGVTAQVGYATGVDGGIHVNGPSANVTIDLPLTHAAEDRLRAQRERVIFAQAGLRGVTASIQLEVESAFRAYGADRDALAAATRAREEAASEVRAAIVGYRSGASSSLDLIDARRTYARAAIAETNAQAELERAGATVVLVTGETLK